MLIKVLCCAWAHIGNSPGDVPGLADGQGIAGVSVLLNWTGWDSKCELTVGEPMMEHASLMDFMLAQINA